MQYIILKQLKQMIITLQEVSEILAANKQDDIVEQAFDMIGVIKSMLEKHKNSITNYAELTKDINEISTAFIENKYEELYSLIYDFYICFVDNVKYKFNITILAELGEKWDALNSLYEALKKRDDCSVKIVLTPVYRLNMISTEKNDKSRIYKDYFTLLNIPFIDYNLYDLKKDAPDMVFMSQPYDDCSDDEYCSENISKYTRLVYVPYFVAHQYRTDHISALCMMPIFYNAWRTLGYSKKHFDFYQEHSYKKGRNMIVTGIPKMDASFNLKNKVCFNAELDRICKGKTVILWNNFYDLPSSSLHYFAELLKFFVNHQDFVLIWRRHPLTVKTAELTYPHLYDALISMIDVAHRAPNIVIDDEAYYDNAFAYSHALISDFSSIMIQYLFMDKPVLWMVEKGWVATQNAVSDEFMEKAHNFDDIEAFLQRVKKGIDLNKEIRAKVIERDLPLADGNCGERAVQELIEILKEEEGLV